MRANFGSSYNKFSQEQVNKLKNIENEVLTEFIGWYVDLMEPSDLFVLTDSEDDKEFVRLKALLDREEKRLKNRNHTYHFDNYYDQARDKENTKILTPNGESLPFLNTMKREDGIKDIESKFRGIMKGRTMYIGFFILGPYNSPMSEYAVQITDSPYVLHSEIILYRTAYEDFVKKPNLNFMKFVHSEGELDERKVSKNLRERRIYFDNEGLTAFSVNTQYAGNTVGLKKPAFRLTIYKALKEGWLSEHMFLMGVNGPNGRVTYFTGAFPSMCGKTSTCMVPGERLVGDDLSFIKVINGKPYAINIENGIFGIIDGINKEDDPIIWSVLHSNAEVIFSNVLVSDGKPYWVGMGEPIPDRGENHSGTWYKGKKMPRGRKFLHLTRMPDSLPHWRISQILTKMP